MKRISMALLAAITAVSVWAQAPKVVGTLLNVTGLVTVSRGDQLVNAVNNDPLVVGNRIITTNSGGVTLSFRNGCIVTLKPNQSFTVPDSTDCAVLVGAVQSIGLSVESVAVGSASASVNPLVVLGGGGLIYILTRNSGGRISGS